MRAAYCVLGKICTYDATTQKHVAKNSFKTYVDDQTSILLLLEAIYTKSKWAFYVKA